MNSKAANWLTTYIILNRNLIKPFMEQQILTWSYDSIDYIGKQLKDYIDYKCIDGWYVHQILPIHQQEYDGGNLRLISCIIILHKQKENGKK